MLTFLDQVHGARNAVQNGYVCMVREDQIWVIDFVFVDKEKALEWFNRQKTIARIWKVVKGEASLYLRK